MPPPRDYSRGAADALAALRQNFHAASTGNARATAIREYENLCSARELQPWPACAANLELLAAFMLDSGQPASGLAYISHVRTENKLRHGVDVLDSPYLRFVNAGLKRGMGLEREDYHPWSLTLIRKICEARGLTAKDKILSRYILVQFWCMLRPEEIIACKLTVTEGKLCCKVAQSKADQDAVGRTILLNATGEWACPVAAASVILEHDRLGSVQSYRNQLKKLLERARVQNTAEDRRRDVFLPHGIRKGAAQAYLLGGTARELVQKLGGWKAPASLMRYEAQVMLNPGDVLPATPPLASLQMQDEPAQTDA